MAAAAADRIAGRISADEASVFTLAELQGLEDRILMGGCALPVPRPPMGGAR
jgi:hypothetical protein